MSSKFSDRSEEENQRNLERFNPLMYQMKGSTDAASPTRSSTCDIVGQEPGCYAYPSGDQRITSNDQGLLEEENVEIKPDDETALKFIGS